MKKLIVEKDLCIGCGACMSIDPDHFDWDDENLSEAISQDNLDSNNLQNAIESCPTNAIKITTERETDVEGCEGCDSCDCKRDTQELNEGESYA